MKKFVSSVILTLMFYNLFGYFILYLILEKNYKEDASKICSSSKNIPLTKIKVKMVNGKISDPDLDLLDENEITYKGHLYDIVKTETADGYIFLYCFHDKKEEHLRNYFFDHVKQNSSSYPKSKYFTKGKIKKCIQHQIVFYNPEINFEKEYFTPPASFSINYSSVGSPPPKVS